MKRSRYATAGLFAATLIFPVVAVSASPAVGITDSVAGEDVWPTGTVILAGEDVWPTGEDV